MKAEEIRALFNDEIDKSYNVKMEIQQIHMLRVIASVLTEQTAQLAELNQHMQDSQLATTEPPDDLTYESAATPDLEAIVNAPKTQSRKLNRRSRSF